MPTSTWKNISTFIEIIRSVQPRSFLDIGIGFGRWGLLVREYTDVWETRCKPSEWNTCIEGIEIYEPYIGAHQRAIYNKIYIGDVRVIAPTLTLSNYEMIMAGDVLEHMPKNDAIDLITLLKKSVQKVFVISIPLGNRWLRKSYNENQYEAHISSWEEDEIIRLGARWKNIVKVPDGREVGLFCFLNSDYLLTKPKCPYGMVEIG